MASVWQRRNHRERTQMLMTSAEFFNALQKSYCQLLTRRRIILSYVMGSIGCSILV